MFHKMMLDVARRHKNLDKTADEYDFRFGYVLGGHHSAEDVNRMIKHAMISAYKKRYLEKKINRTNDGFKPIASKNNHEVHSIPVRSHHNQQNNHTARRPTTTAASTKTSTPALKINTKATTTNASKNPNYNPFDALRNEP